MKTDKQDSPTQRIKNFIIHCLGKRMSYKLMRYRRYLVDKKYFIPKAIKYNKREFEIIQQIHKKDKITIIFFVYTLGMWKYDGLLKLLSNDIRFRPIIIPEIKPSKKKEVNLQNYLQIVDYCKDNGYRYIDGYDFNTDTYLDISGINPDIVVYTQPYNYTYDKWKIENFYDNSLFIYTPYGVTGIKDKILHDTFLLNIAWKVFCVNSLEAEQLLKEKTLKKRNLKITGASLSDVLQNKDFKSPWKNKNKIKIIWAPHHSIDNFNGFNNSTFISMCSIMLNIADVYKDYIEIAFKPHPVLYDRLLEVWGEGKTNDYYNHWKNGDNTFIETGAYDDLFATSDAMIHDCGSFVCEYLLFNKPVLYMCNSNEVPPAVNGQLGKACFMCHYHGHTNSDVIKFIMMLMKGQDEMYQQRTNFINNFLIPPNGKSVAQNMYNEFLELTQPD